MLFVGFVTGCDTFPGQQTSGSDDWIEISCGAAHTCGIHSNGVIECWGCGDPYDFGQCEAPEGSYTALSAGMWHTCAIMDSGKVACWGCEGDFLGTTNNKGQCYPPTVATVGEAISVGTGLYHSCGLFEDGVNCFGCFSDNWNVGQCWDDEE
jgi:alpha-tubulin suppressor-like RCC1 family protein